MRYDRQKLDTENMLKAATHAGMVRGVGLRLPTVFGHGPVLDRGAVAAMVRRAPAEIFGAVAEAVAQRPLGRL